MSLSIYRDNRTNRQTLALVNRVGIFSVGQIVYAQSGAKGEVQAFALDVLLIDADISFSVGDVIVSDQGQGQVSVIVEEEIIAVPVQIASLEIDGQTTYTRSLMAADKISARFNLRSSIKFIVDDYIIVDGVRYVLKSVPEADKISEIEYEYNLDFYGEAYVLYDKILFDEGVSKFSYAGTPFDFLSLILTNMQALDPAWSLGQIDNVEEIQTLTFDDQSCRTALTQIAEVFNLEWTISNKSISLIASVGEVKDIQFLYGKNNALYTIQRKSVDESFATRWYGYGGTQNLPESYRNNLGRLTFAENPIDRNTLVYGVKEGAITFDEIYPKREAVVESSSGPNEITDATIDFDLNDQILVDGSARIVFLSGDLIGNEFVIRSYDHTAKSIIFNSNEEESGYILPNDNVKPSVGDKYTLVGIEMPSSYVEAAEATLKAKTEAYALDNSSPKVSYGLVINEKFAREQSLFDTLNPGDSVRVIDADLGVDAEIRIQSITYPLVNPGAMEIEISDDVVYTFQEKVAKNLGENRRAITDSQDNLIYARRVADEIRYAAILNEFKKTYVGERAVLTGAFVAGNPSEGAVGGVSGADAGEEAVVFWAGSDYDNKETAPFRVLKNGQAFTSGLEVAEGCVLAIFQVQSDGLAILTEDGDPGALNYRSKINSRQIASWSEGDDLLKYWAQFPIGTVAVINIKSALEGIIRTGTSTDANNVVAGVTGMIQDHIAEFNVYDQLQGANSTQKYGGLFSSIKNLGAKYEAMRENDAATINMTSEDYHIIAEQGCNTVVFPDRPDHGYTCEVKNYTSGNIGVISAQPSTDRLIGIDNAEYTSALNLPTGVNLKFRYHATLRRWFQLG